MDRTLMVRAGTLARLRTRIRELETETSPFGADEMARLCGAGASWKDKDRKGGEKEESRKGGIRLVSLWPGVAVRRGVLHEVRSADWRETPAAAGFALGLAARVGEEDSGLFALIERAPEGRDGLLSARGLRAFGTDPARALFIRVRTDEHALWAAEEAARSRGVAAAVLILRGKAPRLTLTATRRLHLAAMQSGATPLIVRLQQPSEMTAASMRWRIEPRPSAPAPFDAKAPGAPCWRVTVEKAAAAGRLSLFGRSFLVEWRHAEKRFVLSRDEAVEAATPAHSGARLPASFHRFSPAPDGDAGARAARAS